MPNKYAVILLCIIIFAHIFILAKVIYFPYPEFFIYPYLTNHGLKPYSQILDQHFPGLMFFPINLNNLGMTTEQISRIWLIGIVILTQFLLFFISSRILKSDFKALLVNFLYLIWQPFFEGWIFWIDSFLSLLLIPAFYALYKKQIFISGLLLGIGIVFKQTLIPLAFFVLIYLFWQKKAKKVKTFLVGFLIPLALMFLYLSLIGVLKDFFYWTIIFNLTTYAKSGTTTPNNLGFITRILFVYALSFMALFYQNKRLLLILSIFITGSFLGIFDRANFIHLQPSLPFVLFATTLGLTSLKRKWLIPLLIIYFSVGSWWMIIFYRGHISNKVFFFDDNTKLIASKIKKYTNPGEKIFVFGGAPHLYQMSQTLPAGNIFVFQFPWFLKIAEGRILDGLKKDKPNIVVEDRTVEIEGLKLIDFAKDIDQYINSYYTEIDRVSSVSILRRTTD